MTDGTTTGDDGWAGELRALLGQPIVVSAAARVPARSLARRALIAFLTLAGYGAVAGLFRGGPQVAESALKAPLIVGFAILLCLPSLVIFTALSGLTWSGRQLAALGTAALAGLVLLGLLPIAWLFSVSSRYLGFVSLVHVGCWLIAATLAGRSLSRSLREAGGHGTGWWTTLIFIVALQAATLLRPVLWRQPGQGWRATEKRFFVEHYLESAELRPAAPTGDRR